MNTYPIFLFFFIIFFFLLITLPQSYSQENDTSYSMCSQPYNCGSLTNISYPFWGQNRPDYCGASGFQLECHNNQNTTIQSSSQVFNVLHINQTDFTMRLVLQDFAYDVCPPNGTNTTLSGTPFRFLPNVGNMSIFYDCPSQVSGVNNFTCGNDSSKLGFYVRGNELEEFPGYEECGFGIQVPVLEDNSTSVEDSLKKVLEEGFDVMYDASDECTTCRDSGGLCGTSQNDGSVFSCYCHDGAHGSSCSTHNSRKNKILKLVLAFVGTAIGLPLIAVTICRNKERIWRMLKTQFGKKNDDDKDIESFLQSQGPLPLKRYTFSDVKKMTDSFKHKLGEGGYGSVYKGKLLADQYVAVKLLNESKGNSEEFINEVASISKTSHVNVVTLLGFCLEGRRKALVYEFMSNGSLEKFIYKKQKESDETPPPSLSWENLYEIALGIARGLQYLHKGCNTRILHFDIKPHNILLDEKYQPKISDFGLAKLNHNKEESIISMSNARGTVGYVAPEVWNKSFGGVSHKSDVYSYGMMLLEMVGGQKLANVEASTNGTDSEKYFPHLVIYKKLEEGNELVVDGVMRSEENEIAKKMTMVGLWCIQTIPAHRPTISRVIEMLEGGMEVLEMPPKPILSSPSRSTPESFSTLSSFQSVYSSKLNHEV
ncbi:LEAF RUST 10 DISEASE-RESISTANCE LOCUS RECEPTOR-LIKE PROTEIN KINASE-like 2.1 [Senna tora]|uniref:non-specific serine/threonine protein kinase n=1 Tax=Senna tora TaxID=362788 RepID=A0A834TFE0_9FABA|nr:LEAF RUST 10 DISEASE-RESISTANCE LOCUS RECEPTOR-LIKE PROTEIN KINASE-like 2.1 [Senna tora]